MAEAVYTPQLAIQDGDAPDSLRHPAVVRITHWINTVSFFALLVSGVAILLAHPRLYWGETGAVGAPSLIDLPLPFVLVGQSGWGRYLHFLSAWVCVFNGGIYALHGLWTRHFRKQFLPAKADLSRGAEEEALTYNVVQRLTYLIVVFGLFPLVIWSGLAMSPALTSVFPGVVTSLGGQQSARTIHFFVANVLVVFLVVHIGMVCLAGFTSHMRMMITGWTPTEKEQR